MYSKGGSTCLVSGKVLGWSQFYLWFFLPLKKERKTFHLNVFCWRKCYKCLWSWELDMVEVKAEEVCDHCCEPFVGCLPPWYDLVGWLNACQILPKFKHCIIELIFFTGVLQITSMWDVVSSFLKTKKPIAGLYSLQQESVLCWKRVCQHRSFIIWKYWFPDSLPSSFRGINVVWKLHKRVLWQFLSKLPVALDIAFQSDFINLALAFLGERWQRILTSYFSFEALILKRTVPFFFFCFQIQHVRRYLAGCLGGNNLQHMWKMQPQTE